MQNFYKTQFSLQKMDFYDQETRIHPESESVKVCFRYYFGEKNKFLVFEFLHFWRKKNFRKFFRPKLKNFFRFFLGHVKHYIVIRKPFFVL